METEETTERGIETVVSKATTAAAVVNTLSCSTFHLEQIAIGM